MSWRFGPVPGTVPLGNEASLYDIGVARPAVLAGAQFLEALLDKRDVVQHRGVGRGGVASHDRRDHGIMLGLRPRQPSFQLELGAPERRQRSEEHPAELQALMRTLSHI